VISHSLEALFRLFADNLDVSRLSGGLNVLDNSLDDLLGQWLEFIRVDNGVRLGYLLEEDLVGHLALFLVGSEGHLAEDSFEVGFS
jgi:hypothetical protein